MYITGFEGHWIFCSIHNCALLMSHNCGSTDYTVYQINIRDTTTVFNFSTKRKYSVITTGVMTYNWFFDCYKLGVTT